MFTNLFKKLLSRRPSPDAKAAKRAEVHNSDLSYPSGTCRPGHHNWAVIYTDDDQCQRSRCGAIRYWPGGEIVPNPFPA